MNARKRLLAIVLPFFVVETQFLVAVTGLLERQLVVVVVSYNNREWYKRNLASIFSQSYSHYRVIYIDDCSTDGTGNLVEQYIEKIEQSHRVLLIKNETRCGAAANRYKAYRLCQDHEIILVLDGDDWFAHSRVMKIINKAYSDNYTWVSYGQYVRYPEGRVGMCRKIPNNFREEPWRTSHLRTFYAWLAKRVRKKDLLYEAEFFLAATDLAEMFPILEMAGPHSRFIPNILYVYNCASTLNNFKINREFQLHLDQIIRSRPSYRAIVSPTRKIGGAVVLN